MTRTRRRDGRRACSRTLLRTAVGVAAVFLVAAVALGAAPAAVSADDIEVVVSEDTFAPDEEATLFVEVVDRADGPGGTQGTIVSIDEEDAPITVLTDEDAIATVPTGGSRVASFDIAVDEDAAPDDYDIEVEVDYRDGRTGDLTTETFDVEITIDDRAHFRVVDTDTDAHVGEEGTVSMTLENVGDQTAKDATVEVRALDRGLRLGARSTFTRTFAGDWEDGATRTLNLSADVREGTEPRSHVLEAEVEFHDEDDVERTTRPLTAGVDVGSEQAFSVTNVTSDLRVGEDGELNVTIENDGPRAVGGVVAVSETPNPNVAVRNPEWYVGPMEPGEASTAAFRVGLREDAEPGDRVLPLVVRYRTPAGDIEYSDRLDVVAAVAPELEPFGIRAVNQTIAQGETRRYRVEVENTGDERYSDIQAKLFAESPLETDDDEAYIDALDVGETRTISFGLEADDDAAIKQHPVSMDFRYEDADGDRHLTDRERMAVDVVERETPYALYAAVVVFLAAIVGIAYWKRERLAALRDDIGG